MNRFAPLLLLAASTFLCRADNYYKLGSDPGLPSIPFLPAGAEALRLSEGEWAYWYPTADGKTIQDAAAPENLEAENLIAESLSGGGMQTLTTVLTNNLGDGTNGWMGTFIKGLTNPSWNGDSNNLPLNPKPCNINILCANDNYGRRDHVMTEWRRAETRVCPGDVVQVRWPTNCSTNTAGWPCFIIHQRGLTNGGTTGVTNSYLCKMDNGNHTTKGNVGQWTVPAWPGTMQALSLPGGAVTPLGGGIKPMVAMAGFCETNECMYCTISNKVVCWLCYVQYADAVTNIGDGMEFPAVGDPFPWESGSETPIPIISLGTTSSDPVAWPALEGSPICDGLMELYYKWQEKVGNWSPPTSDFPSYWDLVDKYNSSRSRTCPGFFSPPGDWHNWDPTPHFSQPQPGPYTPFRVPGGNPWLAETNIINKTNFVGYVTGGSNMVLASHWNLQGAPGRAYKVLISTNLSNWAQSGTNNITLPSFGYNELVCATTNAGPVYPGTWYYCVKDNSNKVSNIAGHTKINISSNKQHFISFPYVLNGQRLGDCLVLDTPMQNGAKFYTFGPSDWVLAATWTTNGWDHPGVCVNTGTGYMLQSSNNTEMVFSGTVQEGAVSYNIPHGHSTIANRVAKVERFPGHAVGHEGDTLFQWDAANQTWGDYWTYMAQYLGWVNMVSGDTTHPDGPMLNPGEALYYDNTGNGIVFTRNHNVSTPSPSGYYW